MKEELEELLDEHHFSSFVVTAVDGFSIAINKPAQNADRQSSAYRHE
jgi:hypothetical protein